MIPAACPGRLKTVFWAGGREICRKEETIMGIDWESILDAENDDLQTAYEDLAFEAMEKMDAELEWERKMRDSWGT